MKTLIFFLIGFMALGQPIKIDTVGLDPEIKEAVQEVEKEKVKGIILEKKIKQANAKTEKLKKKIESLIQKSFKKGKLKIDTPNYQIQYFNNIDGILPKSEIIYWEEFPRKWAGRLFYKDNFKIRIYKFDNYGKKIYLD